MAGSPDVVARAAYAVGLRGDALVTAVAISGAESGFGANVGPSATNDYGDWQINSPAHPQYNTGQLLADPNYNAQAMYAISSAGTNWQPWTTYTSGAYTKYLGQAQAAVAKLGTSATSDPVTGATLTSDILPGGSYDPLNWPTEAVGAASDSVANSISSGLSDLAGALFFLLIKVTLVGTGGALIVLGLGDTASKSKAAAALSSLPIPIPA